MDSEIEKEEKRQEVEQKDEKPFGAAPSATSSGPSGHGEPHGSQKPKKGKKIIKKIGGWILYLLFVAALVIGIPSFLSTWLETDTPIAAITSSSMWPALKKGDLILIQSVDKEEIAEGDIIVYQNQRGFTIHRVVKIDGERIITKGDANNVEDKPIAYDVVVGRTFNYSSGNPVRIPKLGYISVWAGEKFKPDGESGEESPQAASEN